MLRNAATNEFLDILISRLPGEGIQEAVARGLQSGKLLLWHTVEVLKPWRNGDGLWACKVFLPSGTRVRHTCARCKKQVLGSILRYGVTLEDGTSRESLEGAKYAAMNLLPCSCRARYRRSAGYHGRPVPEFWEIEHYGVWKRLSFFRVPWD
jgi:hypothetical protein